MLSHYMAPLPGNQTRENKKSFRKEHSVFCSIAVVTLDFEKLKIKQDWEEKLLNVVAGPAAKVA